jgi:hypothetical protein
MSLSDPNAISVDQLDVFVQDARKKYVLTCHEIHITYTGHHPISLEALIGALEQSLDDEDKTKAHSISELSAVQDFGTCKVTGREGGSTHIAVRLKGPPKKKFRICSLTRFSVMGIAHIRLIKNPEQWAWIVDVFHRTMGEPLRRIPFPSSGSLVVSHGTLGSLVAQEAGIHTEPLPPKARGDVERYMRAKKAFDEFVKTNTDAFRKILTLKSDGTRGTKSWYSFYEDASSTADYLWMKDLAVVFQDCWSLDDIATELQKICNTGVRPNCVILCYSTDRPRALPKQRQSPMDIIAACDMICSGALRAPRFRSEDTPLGTWRPHVFVFANFHPQIVSNMDRGDWILSLPSQMNHTGHLLVPREHVNTIVEVAKRHLRPAPEVLGMEDVVYNLKAVLRDFRVSPESVPDAFQSVQAAACAMLSVFTPQIMVEYWRRGYEPLLTIYTKYKQRLGGGRVPDLELAEETVPFTERTSYVSIIGKTAKIGNVFIRSGKLSEEGLEIAAKKIAEMGQSFPTLEFIDDALGGAAYATPLGILPNPLDQPVVAERRSMGPFDVRGGAFPGFGYVNEGEVYRFLDAFLSGYDSVQFGFITPTPLGDVESKGWLIESKEIIVEVDFEAPSKGEAYKMLYWWNEKGIRTIRMRADEVCVDWQFGLPSTAELEHAIRDRASFYMYLDRERGRDSWKELKKSISPYSGSVFGHETWWEENVGLIGTEGESVEPEPRDIDEAPESSDGHVSEGEPVVTVAQSYTMAEPPQRSLGNVQERTSGTTRIQDYGAIPSVASGSAGTSSEARGATSGDRTPIPGASVTDIAPMKPKVIWAIYCRTITGSDDLLAQRNHCLTHAKANSLVPIAGKNYFEDCCSAGTPPGARPGLQAFLKSGATGMLCAHGTHLAERGSERAAVEYLRAYGVMFRAVDV